MKLGLFFTLGVSLKVWVEQGLIDREKSIYHEHLNNNDLSKIYWFTYGETDESIASELVKSHKLENRIQIVSKPALFRGRLGNYVYSFLLPIIKKEQLRDCDLFKTNQMSGAWTALLAKLLYKKPLFLRTGYTKSLFLSKQSRSRFKYIFFRFIENLMYKSADVSYVSSNNDRDYVLENYLKDQEKVELLQNYIDTDVFKPLSKQRRTDRLVFVGRLNTQKNLRELVRALSGLNIGLDVYGDGEEKEQLRNLALEHCVDLEFKGFVDNKDLPGILNEYKYFILPSLYEGMPKTLLEAMLCACICIGTDVEGINEVIDSGKNGILVKGTDAASIAKVLGRLNEVPDNIALEARFTIEDKFSLAKIAEKENGIFRKVSNKYYPLISVVMSVYNGEKYLSKSIESILSQTYSNFEFIIINDGSTDSTADILDIYAKKDARIKIIAQENIGLTRSLNKAISKASGSIIARQDADDISNKHRFKKQIQYLDKYDFVCSRTNIDNNKVSPKYISTFLYLILLRFKNVFIHGSFMFKRSLFVQVDGYDESIAFAQDYDLVLKMIKYAKARVKYIAKVLYYSSKDADCISLDKRDKQQACAQEIRKKYFIK